MFCGFLAWFWETETHLRTCGSCHVLISKSERDIYGWTYVEVAYRETMIHSTKIVLGDVSSGRMVGVSPWCIIVWSTYPSQHQCWAQYILFSSFYDIKIYIYYVFKYICIIKEILVVFNFALARRCRRGFSNQPISFKRKINP